MKCPANIGCSPVIPARYRNAPVRNHSGTDIHHASLPVKKKNRPHTRGHFFAPNCVHPLTG